MNAWTRICQRKGVTNTQTTISYGFYEKKKLMPLRQIKFVHKWQWKKKRIYHENYSFVSKITRLGKILPKQNI